MRPATILIDKATLARLCDGDPTGGDATHDILLIFLARDRIVEDPDRGAFLIADPGANTATHAYARLRLAIRQRANRLRQRHATDTTRAQVHTNCHLAAAGTGDPCDLIRSKRLAGPLAQALATLTDLQRACLHARVFHDAPYPKIAAFHNITPAAARQHVARARSRLSNDPTLRAAYASEDAA